MDEVDTRAPRMRVEDRVGYTVTLGECVELLEGIMPREARGPLQSFDG